MSKAEKFTIYLSDLKSIRGDVNKKVATFLKSHGVSVVDADVLVLCDNERGRCWTKPSGKTSCVAHG